MVNKPVAAQFRRRTIRKAEADGDDGHAGGAGGHHVDDRIADKGDASATGARNGFAEVQRIGLFYGQAVAAQVGDETAAPAEHRAQSSEERRVGKERVCTSRFRWWPSH